MNGLRSLLGAILFALMAAACSVGGNAPVIVDELHEAQVYTINAKPGYDRTEEEIEISLNGIFAHPCARISHVNQEIRGRTISLEVETARTGKDGCDTREGMIAEFIHVVPIDTESLQPGTYAVHVGDLSTSFEVE